jgi:hypothetical protein
MTRRKKPEPLTLDAVVSAGARSLPPGARWCILHADGPLITTASLDFTYPVMVACWALHTDWDHLRESGFWLGQVDADGKAIGQPGIPTIEVEP